MTACCNDFKEARRSNGIYQTREQRNGEIVKGWRIFNMGTGLDIYYCPFCGTSLEWEEE